MLRSNLCRLSRRCTSVYQTERKSKFIQGYSSIDNNPPWCRKASTVTDEKISTIFKVDEISIPPLELENAVEKVFETGELDYLPKKSKIVFKSSFKLETEKGKLQKRFDKLLIQNGVDIENGGFNARICVVCDPNDVSKAFENGATIAGSSKMMLDFIYDRPKVDYVFVTENQFEVFRRNDTFQSALKQMNVNLPAVKNEKRGIYNEFVIKEIDSIKKYVKPLLSGDKSDIRIILGELSMNPDQIVDNMRKVEEEIQNLFKWATNKTGKAADKDKLYFKDARLEIKGMEPFYIQSSNEKLEF